MGNPCDVQDSINTEEEKMMSQGELPDSLESKRILIRFFAELLVETMEKFSVTPGELIHHRFKKQHIMPARDYVVMQLRNLVYRKGAGKSATLRVIHDEQRAKDEGWHHVGWPMLARLLGCDHSALSLRAKRIALCEAKKERETNEQEALPL